MPTTDPLQYARENPEQAFMEAKKVSQETGADIRAAATRAGGFMNQADVETLGKAPTQYGVKSTPGEFDNVNADLLGARASVIGRMNDEFAKAQTLEQADENLIRKRILLERQPTEEIDNRIRELLKEKSVTKAILNDEMKNLSPSQRRAAVANRLRNYGTTVDNLMEIRKKRLDKIEGEVLDEVSTLKKKHDGMTARMNILQAASDEIEALGGDREASKLMELTVEKARTELERVRRAMNKAGVTPGGMDDDAIDTLVEQIIASGGQDSVSTFFKTYNVNTADRQKIMNRLSQARVPEVDINGEPIVYPVAGPTMTGEPLPPIQQTRRFIDTSSFILDNSE